MERCRRCGRKLKTEKSIKDGYGSICVKLVEHEQLKIKDIKGYFT